VVAVLLAPAVSTISVQTSEPAHASSGISQLMGGHKRRQRSDVPGRHGDGAIRPAMSVGSVSANFETSWLASGLPAPGTAIEVAAMFSGKAHSAPPFEVHCGLEVLQ
jgi:hypothetical protein